MAKLDYTVNQINEYLTKAKNSTTDPTRIKELIRELFDNVKDLAYNNIDNDFSTSQTINGSLIVNGPQIISGPLTIEGDITLNGESYITHAEDIYTKQDTIHLREGATGGLVDNTYAGLVAENYDGVNNGLLVFDNSGEARVGDDGDTQPLLTREEKSNLPDGALLRWDATKLCAVPMNVEIVDMVVTYEDDSTRTFKILCDASE